MFRFYTNSKHLCSIFQDNCCLTNALGSNEIELLFEKTELVDSVNDIEYDAVNIHKTVVK